MATTSDLPSPFLDPSLQADYQAALKKRQLAQQLMGAFQQTNQTNPGWNNMALVPRRGALQNVASLVTALGAGKFSRDADKASEDYLQKYNAPEQAAPVAQAAPPVAAAPGVLPDPNAPAAGPAPVAPAASQNKMIPDGMDRRTAQMLVGTLGPAEYTKQFLAPNFKLSDFDKDLRAAGIRPNTPEYAQALQDKIYKDTQVGPIHANAGDVLLDPKTHLPVATVASNRAHTAEGMFVDPAGKYYDADGKPLTDAQVQDRILKFSEQKAAAVNSGRGGGPGGDLTGDALDTAAQDYRRTGKLPPLARDNATKMKIMNRSAELARAEGNDAAATVLDRQNFKANQLALNKVTSQKNMVGSFEKTFEKNLQLTEQLSKNVDRTGSPLINRGLQAWRTGVAGDPDTKAFMNALTTARDEYAKILSGATGAAGITDSARHEAEQLFSTIDSPETLAYVANVARQETHNRMSSFEEQEAEIAQHLGAVKPNAAPVQHPKAILDILDKYPPKGTK